MTDIVGIGATTHVVEQGADRVQVSKQALEGLCEQIKGDQAFPLRLDHDPSLMPLGKIVDAWIEPYGDEIRIIPTLLLRGFNPTRDTRGAPA